MPQLKAFREPEFRQALIIAMVVWSVSVPVIMAPSLAAPEPIPAWAWLAQSLVALFGFLLTLPLLWVVGATDHGMKRPVRVVLIVAAVATVAMIHSAIDAVVHDVLMSVFQPDSRGAMFVDDEGRLTPAPLHWYVLMNFITLLWVHAGVTALGALSRFNMKVRRHEVASVEARAAANQAKLATLRLQLSPHFMFNTLNAISSLILTGRNADAERMLTRLSDFLRASLGPGESELVSLASELSAVSAYLDIESLRYDGQLEAEIVSDEVLHEAMVPTFLLQPLAEQAVAHAVSPPRRPVVIRVHASRDSAGRLVVTIRARAADGSRSSAPPPLDLATVRSRLAAVYGDLAEIEGASDAGAFTATARLPLGADHAGAEIR
jgi:two-component system LytT family sensor kinase